MMSMLKKIVLFPISLFVAFLALMARWLLTLSSYVVAPLMLYIFGCGIYTAYRQTWDQFLILLVAEFICFIYVSVFINKNCAFSTHRYKHIDSSHILQLPCIWNNLFLRFKLNTKYISKFMLIRLDKKWVIFKDIK